MTRKKLTTWIGAVASITMVGLLTGCSSHPNPLAVAKPNIAAQFLVNASQAAEKSLHVFQAPGGEYYGLCMAGKEKLHIPFYPPTDSSCIRQSIPFLFAHAFRCIRQTLFHNIILKSKVLFLG